MAIMIKRRKFLIKKEPKDFIGQELILGDYVAVVGNQKLELGKVIKINPRDADVSYSPFEVRKDGTPYMYKRPFNELVKLDGPALTKFMLVK